MAKECSKDNVCRDKRRKGASSPTADYVAPSLRPESGWPGEATVSALPPSPTPPTPLHCTPLLPVHSRISFFSTISFFLRRVQGCSQLGFQVSQLGPQVSQLSQPLQAAVKRLSELFLEVGRLAWRFWRLGDWEM